MLNAEEIQKIIPHRPPFLLLDGVTELQVGEYVKAYKEVTEKDWYLQGHFPGDPIMPGVLIIEALAQAGAVCLLSMPEYAGKIALFGGIEKAKFRRKVTIGDCLTLEMTITKLRGHIGKGNARATVNGEVCCVAELTFFC